MVNREKAIARQTRYNAKHSPITLRVSPEIRDRIRILQEENHWTLSEVLEYGISEAEDKEDAYWRGFQAGKTFMVKQAQRQSQHG